MGEELFLKKQSVYFYPSLYIIIFALLDNFGFSGGRNGFLYIEGITAFDTPVSVLFLFFCMFMFVRLRDKKFVVFELITATSLIIFLVQMKLSSVIAAFLYLTYLFLFLKNSNISFKKVLVYLIPNIIIYFFWLAKNIITTGCLIFPLSISCFSNFSWYVPGSTSKYENITTEFSGSYNLSENIFVWGEEFYSIEINRVVMLNFLTSFFIVFVISKLFFTSKKSKLKVINIFIVLNIIYLIFFGPIPRYAIGFLMFCISLIGFSTKQSKIKIHKFIYLSLFISSLILIPRVNSYLTFLNSSYNLSIPSPTLISVNELWTSPVPGEDQCWFNQFCSAEREGNIVLKNGYFLTALREK
tara:strand:- start:3899 stop:4966 length:1068 start_codon:yes stop_codon:yes gene_type:complete